MTDYLHWCGFLDDDLLAAVRATTVSNRQRFVETTVTTNEPGYRKSQVLWHYEYQDLYDKFSARMRSFLPYMCRMVPMIPENPKIELQMTTHSAGEYFKRHIDNGSDDTITRLMTFVYYYALTDVPQFTGGQLILEADDGTFTIEPNHNTIVMFPAGWWHEVLPVTVPSGRWEDGRFTLNGWLHSITQS